MTKWIINLISESPSDDSKVMEIMKRAAKLGLKYTVSSKEVRAIYQPGSKNDTK